ncbi:MAG: NAD(P)/FAD-dependent oxidoreductase [Candidatus Omnitrophota bacterium]
MGELTRHVDALIIGAGPAGLSAALSLKKSGVEDILIVEREDAPGGILLQCIHNGFGLNAFKEELTGPEYAERYVKVVRENNIETLLNTAAVDIVTLQDKKTVILLSKKKGLVKVTAKAVILAMGCRERNRGNIAIPGSRPAGIMTAGFAQKMTNLHGYLPGRNIVVVGSGDIGLIMARRLTWEGCRVKAVVEILPYPGGLNRNIVQCLNDFGIPLYLSHAITNITGARRIKSVQVAPIDKNLEPKKEGAFTLTCDTLLLSVGLIPENELSIRAGVTLDPVTGGAVVDADLMTSIPGIFSCGNVLHVHDLADFVSEEADYCGKSAAAYIQNAPTEKKEIPVKTGHLVRYVLPSRVEAGKKAIISLRPIAPSENINMVVRTDKEIILKKKHRKIFPSTMLRIPIEEVPRDAQYLEVSFIPEEK